jgi:apoptosis-inducing factor 2
MKSNTGLAKTIVIGGGYSGTAIAKLLDRDFDVTLIEKQEMFFHNLGALRAAVDPSWLEKIFIPYSGLLKRGKILHHRVKEVTPDQVHLDNGEILRFDYLILATGSSYHFPAKMSSNDVESSKESILHFSATIREARRILIVGGGPVGVEFAGEIISKYPQKTITLIHAGKTLIGEPFNPKLREKLLEALKAKGVRVVLEERVLLNDWKPEDLLQTQTYITDQGMAIEADLLLLCYGAKVNNEYLRAHFTEQLDRQGRVKVNPQMQVEGYSNIFAVGDITNIDEPKMGVVSGGHASVVAANIKILESNKTIVRQKTLKAYQPAKTPLIIVPLGENDGAGQFPLTKHGLVVGAFLAKQIKSQSLLVEMYWKKLGLKLPK